jgi:hypothetical protein
MVIGIQQVSHSVNNASAYMAPAEWRWKQASSETAVKWNLAVRATRAWRVAHESYLPIEKFADETYSTKRAQFIGSQGMRLTPVEAYRILDLTLIEASVYGQVPVDAAVAVSGRDLLAPSKPGPVSQAGYFCKEAEGPKSLYVLRLVGDEASFLGRDTGGRQIIKVGFSRSPSSRCQALNGALPACAFRWEVLLTNAHSKREFFPSSGPAILAEAALKDYLHDHQESLGGEFFLADEASVARGWTIALEAAG